MADALVSGASDRKVVEVQLLSAAPSTWLAAQRLLELKFVHLRASDDASISSFVAELVVGALSARLVGLATLISTLTLWAPYSLWHEAHLLIVSR